MNVIDILSAACLICSLVCATVGLVLAIVASVKARKLRREIQEMLDGRKAGEERKKE